MPWCIYELQVRRIRVIESSLWYPSYFLISFEIPYLLIFVKFSPLFNNRCVPIYLIYRNNINLKLIFNKKNNNVAIITMYSYVNCYNKNCHFRNSIQSIVRASLDEHMIISDGYRVHSTPLYSPFLSFSFASHYTKPDIYSERISAKLFPEHN